MREKTQQEVKRLCREKLNKQRNCLLSSLRRQDIWQREDIEPFIDELTRQVWQATLLSQHHWTELEENYSKSELGLRSVIEVDTNGDKGGDEEQIIKAIEKLGATSGISGRKRRKARELLEAIASAGYYGYLVLRRKLGIPLEHPLLKPWYAKFLPLIPSLINPGGIILLKEGTFTVSSPVLLTKDYVKIEGAGPSTILTQPDGTNSHIIQIGDGSTPVSYCTIRSLRVNGNKDGQTDTCYGIYAPAPPTGEYNYYNTIEHCVVENCYDEGLYFYIRNWYWYIHNNIIKDNRGSGLYMNGDSCLYSSNMFISNEGRGAEIRCDESVVINNLVRDNNTHGLYVSCSNTAVAANIVRGSTHNYAIFIREPKIAAIGNRIIFSEYGGIYIDGREECVVCANHIEKGGQVAILLQAYAGDCGRCIVADNTIYSPSQSANAGYPAIYLQHYGTEGVKNVLVTHNTIFADTANRPSYGVEESDSLCDYNRIINNYIEGMATGAIKTLGAHTLVRNNFGAINVKTVTADYTMTWADESILADASAAAITVTLPDPATYDTLVFIKKIDSSANAVTVTPHGTETIDGASSMTLANQNDAVRLRSDGSNWFSF